LRVQLAHQLVEIRHLLAVVDSGWWSRLVEILHAIYPPVDLLAFLVCSFNAVHLHGHRSHHILGLHVLEFQHCLVLAVQSWLIQHIDSEVFLLSRRLWHLEERVDFSNCRHVVGNEWLELGLEVNLLGLISLDVLEQVLDILGYLQVGIISWVVGPWDFLLVLVVIIIISATCRLLLETGWLLSCNALLNLLLLHRLLPRCAVSERIDLVLVLVIIRFNFF